jgi:hypothetical protein
MNVQVLHHVRYFDRDLYLLQIDNNKYTKVYRGSGLNGGRKGRVLPFTHLQDVLPRFSEAREGIVPGYIFKRFFYRERICSHGKHLDSFEEEIGLFCSKLEDLLDSYDISDSEVFNEEQFENILSIAKEINSVMYSKAFNLKNFDYSSLIGTFSVKTILS